MKPVDIIRKAQKPVRLVPLWQSAPRRAARRVSRFVRVAVMSKLGLVALLVTAVLPLAAFEAHVVNVTATIERRPCLEFQVQTKTWWKDNPDLWILPQNVGDTQVTTSDEANEVFLRSADNAFTKLKAQLLALKFNISYFGVGGALVPGQSSTLMALALEADALLMQNPEPPDAEVDAFSEYIRSVNLAGTVSTCVTCPDVITILGDHEFDMNGATGTRLFEQVDQGDHVKATFTLPPQCADKQFSLVSYTGPTFVFQHHRAHEYGVYDAETGFFGAGTSTLEVDVPACYFYVAFVQGPVIESMGPDGTSNFYSSQGRLVDAGAGDFGGNDCWGVEPIVKDFTAVSQPLFASTFAAPEESSSTPTSTEPVADENASSTDPTRSTSSGQTDSPQAPSSTSQGGGGDNSALLPLVLGASDTQSSSTPTSTEPVTPSSTEPSAPTSTEPLAPEPPPQDPADASSTENSVASEPAPLIEPPPPPPDPPPADPPPVETPPPPPEPPSDPPPA